LRYAVAHVEALDAVQAALNPDPLANLLPAIRARLVDEMGFSAEMVGGGCYVLASYSAGGGHVWVTGSDGTDWPTGADFMVCAYAANSNGEEGFLTIVREPCQPGAEGRQIGLYEAVQAALSALAEREGH
jgi:hypothetical protein